MELNDFFEEFRQEIDERHILSGNTLREEFFNSVTEILFEADEIIGEPVYTYFESSLSKNQHCQIDGYSWNEVDGVLSLYVLSYAFESKEITLLDKATANKQFNLAKNFFVKANEISEEAENSNEGYDLAYNIVHAFEQEDNEFYNMTEVKIVILTTKSRVASLDILESEVLSSFPKIKVSYQIYDINLLYQINISKSGKSDLVIDFPRPISTIQANKTEEYTSYLCSISGYDLAELYNRYGSRLIEGNIRSFLQTCGKVNKGIRATILKEPEKFFAYNNGITATCSAIKIQDNQIFEIINLQIVNGGQTTASLANVLQNDGADSQLKMVFVPMKLNLVSDVEVANNLIPNISRYANSQNKVSDIDLASNHPYHRRMEDLSRKIRTPLLNGFNYGTYWYYERANGQYAQETYKMSKSIKKNFEKQHPKNQMFKKSDLAKYHNIFEKNPHIASKGGAAAFRKFSEWILKTWDNDNSIIDKVYFKEQVANIIIFQEVDYIVKNAPWYNSYKANINAYSISYLYWWVNKKRKQIDFQKIWNEQKISSELREIFEVITKFVNDYLTSEDRPVANVTEWAKREKCWISLINIQNIISEDFDFGRSMIKKEKRKPLKVNLSVGAMNIFYKIYGSEELYHKFHEEVQRSSNFSADDLLLIDRIYNSEEIGKELTYEENQSFEKVLIKYAESNPIFKILLSRRI